MMNTVISISVITAMSAAGGVKTGKMLGLMAESSCTGCISGLFEINIDTGEATLIGEFGVNPSGGALAVAPDGTLYGSFSGEFDFLVTIDPETAEWTEIGEFGFGAVSGIAFAPDGTLYACDLLVDQLIVVDPFTGSGAVIGDLGFAVPGGLSFDPEAHLFAVGKSGIKTAALYTVNVETAEGILIGPLGNNIFSSGSLEFVGEDLYASATFNDEIIKMDVRSLYSVDPNTGEATVIGPHNPDATWAMNGLAFLPGTGDVDRDGDVDEDDFAIFEECFTGPIDDPEGEPLSPGCVFLDTDDDNDIDCDDFEDFVEAWTEDTEPPVFIECRCDGDANLDGVVDPLDSGYVLARLGCSVGTGDEDCDAADVNGDGVVDPLDSGYVLARFGTCE